MNSIYFNISKFDLQAISNSELMKIKLWIVSEGQNQHQMEIPWSAIEEARPTLVGKPIVAKYNKWKNDVMSHERDEIPVGVILSNDDIFFETDEISGKRWLCANGYLWCRYAQDVVMVLDRDKIKNISMEIVCVETGDDNSIQSFVFSGVTLISTNPAIIGAKAEVLEFSEVVNEVKKQIIISPDSRSIRNNNFYIDILNDKTEKFSQEIIKEESNEIVKEEQINMEFSKTHEMFAKASENFAVSKFSVEDKESEKFAVLGCSDDYVFAYDNQNKKFAAIPYSFADESFSADFEASKNVKVNYEVSDEEVNMSIFEAMFEALSAKEEPKAEEFATDANLEPAAAVERSKEETDGDKEIVDKNKDGVNKAEFDALSVNMSALEAKFAVIEAENTELKTFKENIITQENNKKIDFALSEVSTTMPKEKVEEWAKKVIEFSSVDAWSNALKADAFTYVVNNSDTKKGFNRMAMPNLIEDKKKKGLWD